MRRSGSALLSTQYGSIRLQDSASLAIAPDRSSLQRVGCIGVEFDRVEAQAR
jgi:hypothetical protein